MPNLEIQTGPMSEFGSPDAEELAKLEQEILSSPKVLQDSVHLLIDSYSKFYRDKEGKILTPELTIQIGEGEEAQNYDVFAGYNPDSYYRRVIYRRDTALRTAGEWIVFSGRTDSGISDGMGHELKSAEELGYVRMLLNKMHEGYKRAVTETADNFDIEQHMKDTLDRNIASEESKLASLHEQRQALEQLETPINKFKVFIDSPWSSVDEKSLTEEITAPTLSEAIQKAASRYREINHRTDIQARRFNVYASVDGENYQGLPSEVVEPLFNSISHWDRESFTVENTKKKLSELKPKKQ